MKDQPISTDLKGTAAFFRHLVAGLVLLNVLVVGMTLLALHRSRVQYEEAAAATTRNLSLVLEQYLAATIDRIDAVLIDVEEDAEKLIAAGSADGPALRALINHHGKRQPGVDDLRLADAAGKLMDGRAAGGSAPVSVAQHPHFVRLRDDPQAGLVFSEPRLGTGKQEWMIVVARRIDAVDGSFGGAVCAGIVPTRFNRFFAAIDLGQDGSIGLRDSELRPIARYPGYSGDVSLGNAGVPPELRALVASGRSSGTYYTTQTADRIARTVTYRKVADYPYYVLVGVATDRYLAKWRREVVQLSALAAFFALISGGLAWIFYHLWKIRLSAAERAAQMHALAMELSVTEERERYSIAQDLHDDLGQTLAIAKLKLTALAPDAPLMEEIKQIEALVDEANRSVRSLTQQLSPPILHQFGLVPALQWLAEEMQRAYGLTVSIHDDGTRKRLGECASSMLFRAVRELLLNVAKHAKVAAADVTIATEAGRLVIAVADRGCGFDASKGRKSAPAGGYGLFSVRERMGFIGGEMRIDSRPGAGTVVALSISPEAAAEGSEK